MSPTMTFYGNDYSALGAGGGSGAVFLRRGRVFCETGMKLVEPLDHPCPEPFVLKGRGALLLCFWLFMVSARRLF